MSLVTKERIIREHEKHAWHVDMTKRQVSENYSTRQPFTKDFDEENREILNLYCSSSKNCCTGKLITELFSDLM